MHVVPGIDWSCCFPSAHSLAILCLFFSPFPKLINNQPIGQRIIPPKSM
jgi:hypothetical protein